MITGRTACWSANRQRRQAGSAFTTFGNRWRVICPSRSTRSISASRIGCSSSSRTSCTRRGSKCSQRRRMSIATRFSSISRSRSPDPHQALGSQPVVRGSRALGRRPAFGPQRWRPGAAHQASQRRPRALAGASGEGTPTPQPAGRSFPRELAGACGLSGSYLSRAFKQATGMGPHRWLMKQRIAAAKGLLETTTDDLVSIALASGFADQSNSPGRSPSWWEPARAHGGACGEAERSVADSAKKGQAGTRPKSDAVYSDPRPFRKIVA